MKFQQQIANHPLYLVCGVSGSGKTWVCKQLKEKFAYVPHDMHYNGIIKACMTKAMGTDKPLITESPFGERLQKEDLERVGFHVIPVFVIEDPDLIAKRYIAREGKPIQKAAFTRAHTIINRAKEWNAFYGTSDEVLKYLEKI